MDHVLDVCRIPSWYPRFSANSLPTSFVYLHANEIRALIAGENDTTTVKSVVERLHLAMRNYGYNRFVTVDLAAPTDTPRFQFKRGAVRSAASAWRILTHSTKVRNSAIRGEVTAICIRPFRRMEQAREFRLFIKDGKLKAMSQYWLIRHFARLEGAKEHYWAMAFDFVEKNEWALPLRDLVMDVYFTASGKILVVDLNPFGPPTDPLMLNTWEQDWSIFPGIKIIPPPTVVKGSVEVFPSSSTNA